MANQATARTIIIGMKDIAEKMRRAFHQNQEPNLPKSGPCHPGELLEDVITRFGLTPDDVAKSSGIPMEKLRSIFNGEADIDLALRDQLQKSFPSTGTATLLYKIQGVYDSYKQNGQWPQTK